MMWLLFVHRSRNILYAVRLAPLLRVRGLRRADPVRAPCNGPVLASCAAPLLAGRVRGKHA